MPCFRSNPSIFLLILSVFLVVISHPSPSSSEHFHEIVSIRHYNDVLAWRTRNLLAQKNTTENSMVLAAVSTYRKDPLNNFKYYTGGWNISNKHYIASVGFTAVPFFVIAASWLVICGLSLLIICLCYCCCRKEPYGYSQFAYALSMIFLILFTIVAVRDLSTFCGIHRIVDPTACVDLSLLKGGCIVLFTGQEKLHGTTSNTLNYIVDQAEFTAENLRNVSDYLDAAKQVGVDAVFLPADVQKQVDDIGIKVSSAADTLSNKTDDNSKLIRKGIDGMRWALIAITCVMLFLVFLGLVASIFGWQCLVYFLVVLGWILVAVTFIICGMFLFLHNVIQDTCVAMDEWVENPTAHTSLDDILPCVDLATAHETGLRSKDVQHQLVKVVNNIIANVTNRDFPPSAGAVFYNQSGPLMPPLCNPFKSDLTDRPCEAGEVPMGDSAEVWKKYTCLVSSAGICISPGRLTPLIYSQMVAAVNVTYGLNRYSPFFLDLQDCTFVRETFTVIGDKYCPGLKQYTKWIYLGLLLVSAAVMLSLMFWFVHARERRHRYATLHMAGS